MKRYIPVELLKCLENWFNDYAACVNGMTAGLICLLLILVYVKCQFSHVSVVIQHLH